jgi:hypothetical protein
MPIIGTKGAQSSQGFGQFALSTAANYIEDVFSTYLFSGTDAYVNINNGIDLLGKGGLVWEKLRNGSDSHRLTDTARGAGYIIRSDTTAAQAFESAVSASAFYNNGFRAYGSTGETWTSWTFRKQPKFFDVVTYTGTGSVQSRPHSLGSQVCCVIIKPISAVGSWSIFIRGNGNNWYNGLLESTNSLVGPNAFDSVFTASTFLDSGGFQSGVNYVAYLFASNAGGFGLTGIDNVISCGSYTGNGSATGPVINLGYEPQWLLIKNATNTSNWSIIDNMRGMPVGSNDALLVANKPDGESSTLDLISPTATGFQVTSTSGEVNTNVSTYLYLSIRRGPMKVPTTGTSVFGLNARTGTDANATVTGNAGVSDAVLIKNRGATVDTLVASRLTGTGYLRTSSTAAEVAADTTILQANPWDVMDGVKVGTTGTITNTKDSTYINYLFDRAPGFFDVVCYTGTGVARTVAHNLAVVPELMIVKKRNGVIGWVVYSEATGATKYLYLNTTQAAGTFSGTWNNTAPTISSFTVGTDLDTNQSGSTFVAYLFATCPGVSKVGSYIGLGPTQVINCGFTGGARFVLIKSTSTTGNWYVWDSARGIVASNDPYLVLNSTAAEVTTTDWVDPTSTGFQLSGAAGNLVNSAGVSYIFLAIA